MDTAAAELARLRWAKARRTTKRCPFCGQSYRGVKEQVYCTPAHQQAAATRRVREKRRAGAPAPPRPATAIREPAAGLAYALAEAERAREADDLAGAERWERIAADIARRIAADVE